MKRRTVCRASGLRRGAALAVGLLLAAGCGSSPGTEGAGGTGAVTTTVTTVTTAVDRPTGAGDVVIQVMDSGGLQVIEEKVATVPRATVLGDGTLITPAPRDAAYPGPALAPLQAVKLSGGDVDGLVRRAGELGLLRERLTYGQPGLADASATEVTITVRGITYRQQAYDLTEEYNVLGADLDHRRALRSFVDAVTASRAGAVPWTPTAVAVYQVDRYTVDPDRKLGPPVSWPAGRLPTLTPPTAATQPCVTVEGPELATLLPLLAKATAITTWSASGATRYLAFRPILPGQPRC